MLVRCTLSWGCGTSVWTVCATTYVRLVSTWARLARGTSWDTQCRNIVTRQVCHMLLCCQKPSKTGQKGLKLFKRCPKHVCSIKRTSLNFGMKSKTEDWSFCLCVYRHHPEKRHLLFLKYSRTSCVEIRQNCSTSQCSLMMWFLKAGGLYPAVCYNYHAMKL